MRIVKLLVFALALGVVGSSLAACNSGCCPNPCGQPNPCGCQPNPCDQPNPCGC
jgi:hypothetical protein